VGESEFGRMPGEPGFQVLNDKGDTKKNGLPKSQGGVGRELTVLPRPQIGHTSRTLPPSQCVPRCVRVEAPGDVSRL
jgi:hypothetical protein